MSETNVICFIRVSVGVGGIIFQGQRCSGDRHEAISNSWLRVRFLPPTFPFVIPSLTWHFLPCLNNKENRKNLRKLKLYSLCDVCAQLTMTKPWTNCKSAGTV